MIARLQSLNARQRQLIWSLVANFSTRVPGLMGVLFFLPYLKARIGLHDFATLMTSIALGGSITFMLSGVSFVARRLIGDAFSRGDHVAEANAARGIFEVAIIAILLCSAVIVGYAWVRGSTPIFYVGALVTALAVLGQQQDAVRAAYNEHYVTAIIQVVLQSATYILVLLILPASLYSILLGVAVIQGVPLMASFLSWVGLVRQRPYLLRGHAHQRVAIARQSVILGVGEGLLMASLSFVVLYLDYAGAVADSAWYATTLRLFMVVLVPVVLIVTPLSSYIRLIWNDCPPQRQRLIILGTLFVSLAYSVFVGAAMLVLSRLYVGGLMHIAEPGSRLETLAIFAMFAAIVVFKSYTSISFVVLDGKWLSIGSVTGAVGAIAAGFAASHWLSPIGSVAVFAAALTLAIIMVAVADTLRFDRGVRHAVALAPATS